MLKITLVTIVLFTFLTTNGYSSSPYALQTDEDIVISSAGLALLGSSLLLQSYYQQSLTVKDVENLSRDDVNRFDRFATYNWSPDASFASDIMVAATISIPAVIFLIDDTMRNDFITLMVMYLQTEIYAAAICQYSKFFSNRIRPYAYNDNSEISINKKTDKDVKRSFYSGHAAHAFASSIFMANMFSGYYPTSKWKPLVWTIAIVNASITGILRLQAGKHYATDVITAAAMGTATGLLIPYLHRVDGSIKLVPLISNQSKGLQIGFQF